MFKIVHVVGARPNFMKIAPLMRAMDAHNAAAPEPVFEQTLVHTGQHYSKEMSDLLFEELGLPAPTINLGVGSGSHGEQTGKILIQFEEYILQLKPDMVVVVGDVNSTIACALAAKKLHIPVAHVEAGLRSGDMGMPEEINRVMTDAISDIMFTTEESGNKHLAQENVAADRIKFVGNTMIDSLLSHKDKALQRPTLSDLKLKNGDKVKPYAVVTLHRPSNVDNESTLKGLVDVIKAISKDLLIVFPIHPRTLSQLKAFGLYDDFEDSEDIIISGPQGYLDFMNLTANAKLILSDSGGIQEEATVLRVPCLTLRDNTERPVTISHGTNRLVGSEPKAILDAYNDIMKQDFSSMPPPKFWDGSASARIAKEIELFLKGQHN